jgi:hypothetical protein
MVIEMPVGLDVMATFRITGVIEDFDEATMTSSQQRIDYTFKATRRFANILENVLNKNVEGYVDIEEIDDEY